MFSARTPERTGPENGAVCLFVLPPKITKKTKYTNQKWSSVDPGRTGPENGAAPAPSESFSECGSGARRAERPEVLLLQLFSNITIVYSSIIDM